MKYDYIKNGDCLELMKEIPDGSVDMILCDLPYGTILNINLGGMRTDWDIRIDTKLLFKEYERILRVNGIAVLFSQEPYTSELRTFKQENFIFLYPLIWEKDNFANPLSCNKAPVSYFEDINIFTKKYDKQVLHPLRKYFKDVLSYIGFNSSKQINDTLGHQKADHVFRLNSSQFELCTQNVYQELIEKFKIDKMENFKTYDELFKINKDFKFEYRKIFNLQKNENYMSNVLKFKKDYIGLHPTQKPVALLEYLIRTYTNENDVVLDNCMGSGSTCVAAKNTNRHFIGFELDKNYFYIAQQRIDGNIVIENPNKIDENERNLFNIE